MCLIRPHTGPRMHFKTGRPFGTIEQLEITTYNILGKMLTIVPVRRIVEKDSPNLQSRIL